MAVIGATGGVGSFVTQLADARGSTVVAVTARSGAAQARDYGAAEVIDYGAGDVGAALRQRYPSGVDSVIANYGDVKLLTAVARSLRPGGMVVSPAIRQDDAEEALKPFGASFKSANRLSPARLPELTALLEGGQLRVPPIRLFPLDAADAALSAMASGHVRGKLVVSIR